MPAALPLLSGKLSQEYSVVNLDDAGDMARRDDPLDPWDIADFKETDDLSWCGGYWESTWFIHSFILINATFHPKYCILTTSQQDYFLQIIR